MPQSQKGNLSDSEESIQWKVRCKRLGFQVVYLTFKPGKSDSTTILPFPTIIRAKKSSYKATLPKVLSNTTLSSTALTSKSIGPLCSKLLP